MFWSQNVSIPPSLKILQRAKNLNTPNFYTADGLFTDKHVARVNDEQMGQVTCEHAALTFDKYVR